MLSQQSLFTTNAIIGTKINHVQPKTNFNTSRVATTVMSGQIEAKTHANFPAKLSNESGAASKKIQYTPQMNNNASQSIQYDDAFGSQFKSYYQMENMQIFKPVQRIELQNSSLAQPIAGTNQHKIQYNQLETFIEKTKQDKVKCNTIVEGALKMQQTQQEPDVVESTAQQSSNSQNIEFNVKSLQNDQSQNDIEDFMEKSLKYNRNTIMESIQNMYQEIMSNPDLKDLKNKLAALALSSGALLGQASPAMAAIQGKVSYTEFIEAVKDHQVKNVLVGPSGTWAQFQNTDNFGGSVNLVNDPDFLNIMMKNDVNIQVEQTNQILNNLPQLLGNFGVPLFLLGLVFLFSRNQEGGQGGGMGGLGGGNPMQMGKSKARIQMEPDTQINFDAVAGVDEAKEELAEIVDFLKNPDRYTDVGAKIPGGALLIGPPGTGKTLLAKAVAGEAGVPFLSISAAEFIEMYVGVGASRVRDLFEQAKKNAPCIIFIDELDAVGRQRSQGVGMGNDEREQTINQLLTEMDGFEGNKGVIVLAATNIPEVLDKALLRPGRFDRQIQVGLPDSKGRERILKVHARDKKLADEVNLGDIAKRCLGMSGADLANVMNEAAILGARKKRSDISMDEIYDAIDRMQIGMEKKGAKFSADRQKLVSYHEAGHALLGAVMEEYDLVSKISIVPRGGAGGVTIFTPDEEAMESGMYSKQYLLNRICVGMGGRIAEEIINGKSKVTTGASNDFQQCTSTAKQMVEVMGMSDAVGPRNVAGDPNVSPMARMMGGGNDQGSILQTRIDDEIDRILKEQYDRGMEIMTTNKDILDAIAQQLIEKEKIDGKALLDLIAQMKPELVPKGAQEKVSQIIERSTSQVEQPATAQ